MSKRKRSASTTRSSRPRRLKVDDPIEEVEEERPAVKRQKRKASAGDEELVEETTARRSRGRASKSTPRTSGRPSRAKKQAEAESPPVTTTRGRGRRSRGAKKEEEEEEEDEKEGAEPEGDEEHNEGGISDPGANAAMDVEKENDETDDTGTEDGAEEGKGTAVETETEGEWEKSVEAALAEFEGSDESVFQRELHPAEKVVCKRFKKDIERYTSRKEELWAVYKIFKKCMMLQVKHLGEMAPDIDEKSAQRRERMLVALRNKLRDDEIVWKTAALEVENDTFLQEQDDVAVPEVSAAAKSKAEAELEDVLGDDSTCINEIKELYQEHMALLASLDKLEAFNRASEARCGQLVEVVQQHSFEQHDPRDLIQGVVGDK